ncbi:MAG TPA: hypothetical protein VGQ85_05135 [Candidatus Limnocylindrales bacterium]|nr:hypothetical protein [Candidatus Limnocylindrales bacterium]
MTAIVLPDIDGKTLEQLRKYLPSLSAIEIPSFEMPSMPSVDLPSMKDAGRKADQTLDRLLGRSKAPVWPWVAAGVFVVALVGTIAAIFTWNRRASWARQTDPWAEDGAVRTSVDSDPSGVPDLSGMTMADPDIGTGLTAAEASLSSGSFEDQ